MVVGRMMGDFRAIKKENLKKGHEGRERRREGERVGK